MLCKKANYVFDRTKERRLLYAVYTYDEVAPTTESVGYTYHKPEDDGHDEDNMAGLLQYPFRLYRGVDMFNFFNVKLGRKSSKASSPARHENGREQDYKNASL